MGIEGKRSHTNKKCWQCSGNDLESSMVERAESVDQNATRCCLHHVGKNAMTKEWKPRGTKESLYDALLQNVHGLCWKILGAP